MKTKLISFFAGVLITLFILWIKRTLYLISTADADYNTIYSSKYNEKLFDVNLVGKDESELVQLLGDPLSKYHEAYNDEVLYTDNKDSVFLSRTCYCVRFRGNPHNQSYRRFTFDSAGKVIRAKIHEYNDNKHTYDSLDKAQILSIFGQPNDEIITTCNCEVLSFSGLTKGVQSGKTEKHYVRQVVLNRNNIAVNFIKAVSKEGQFRLYDE
jgi:hypothetical protein